ncbi:phospholipase A2-like [Diabrotica undecimpunctata]|uniref:phospholipase A2-like n=1 Tax=Diabrotica undecimpunctata TaxID=50387 RepID=UPI003B63F4A0
MKFAICKFIVLVVFLDTSYGFFGININRLIGDVDKIFPSLLIFPGTKWCGPGNIAIDDNDFGTENATDACCRAHDHCPDVIEGLESKYNLNNPDFHARLNCDCDMAFYNCLKLVNRTSSRKVGKLYFSGLRNKCFKKDHPHICVQYTWYGVCARHKVDTTQEKKYQWFEVPRF